MNPELSIIGRYMERKNSRVLITVVIIVAFFFLLDPFGLFKKKPTSARPYVAQTQVESLRTTFDQVSSPPAQYVAGLFQDHEIVLMGEMTRVREQVLLLQNLIPALYADGIRNLGVDFALYSDQDKIDKLVTGSTYDESLADTILFDRMVIWGYQEYADVFRAAWKVNHDRPSGAEPFRIVGLNVKQNYQALTSQADANKPEVVRQVFANGIPDVYMAHVVDKEFISSGKKALLYMSMEHVPTRFRNPEYEKKMSDAGITDTLRTGNIIYNEIGDKAWSIMLHSPWQDTSSSTGITYPAGGAIDSLIDNLPADKRVAGFTVRENAFGKLPITASSYASGSKNLTLGDLTDGYIVLGKLADYHPVTPIPDFINDANLAEAVKNFPGPNIQDKPTTKDMNDFISNLSSNLANLIKTLK